jgi:CRP/FNR family transcriptional regulator, dissimilatory nitrate respiration regulator
VTDPQPQPLELLSRHPLFAALEPQKLQNLFQPILSQTKTHTLERHHTFLSEGDALEWVFLVLRGRCKTNRFSPSGNKEIILDLQEKGDLIGLEVLFLPTQTYGFSGVALERSTVLALPALPFRQTIVQHPALMQALLSHLSSQQQRTQHRLEQVQFAELGERLSAFLLSHSSEHGFILPTNSELAALLGSVPEVVSRKLGEFYRAGKIRLERRIERRRVWLEGEKWDTP